MPKTCPVCGATYPDVNIFCAADGTTLRAADAQGDLIGSVIADRYLITDLLGEGGMGKVYLARHVRLPQQAAIKVLRPDQVRDASAIARFNREAAAASRIDHDRVARVYDFGETGDGVVYLAMEFVAGRTLKAILAADGPLPPRRVATLTRQIADGLDAAHRLGIVHRDLKPDNVLVVEGGADGHGDRAEHDDRVKVVDFGIAKALGSDDGGAGLTRTGYVVGTPEFMSPEQLLGADVDARSDVYALGLVAYEMLTGELPFAPATAPGGLTARLTEAPRLLAEARPSVPWSPEVQAVFTSTLARDRDARPATAGAFARALGAAIAAWEAPAPGEVRAELPASATSAIAPPVAPLDAPVAAPSAPRVAAAPAPAPAAPAAPRSRAPLVGAGVGLAIVVGLGAFALARRPAEPSGASAAVPAGVSASVPAAVPAAVPAVIVSTPAAAPAPAGSNPATPAPAPPSARGGPPNANAVRPATAAAASTPSPGAAPPPATRANARHTLDSIAATLDPATADAEAGRAAVGPIRALLPRLTTPDDSASAYIRLVEAGLLANDQGRACAALRLAHAVARAQGQREALKQYDGLLNCP